MTIMTSNSQLQVILPSRDSFGKIQDFLIILTGWGEGATGT